ncbi:MAG: ribosome maturation factor RimP [Coriobacteriaceae bacterium]|nr:ribosome maturation factor RimP [Coriobacteriaceae bacterium]
MVKSPLEARIIEALEARAAEHGIDVVDVEVVGATKAPCVRVRIDHPDEGGITLDEVSAESGWVSEVVEGVDPFTGSYTLEVSSPGMARPLRRAVDFARHVGEAVELTTTATEGRRRYKGVIEAADDAGVTLALDGSETATIPFDEVKKCTLKPVYDFKGVKEGN